MRADVIAELADRLAAVRLAHPLRVGIDGACGSGKSTLARDLVAVLVARGRAAVRLDSDGFHHTRALRRQPGSAPARGYYEHAYDFDALVQRCLRPLGPDGSRVYATKVHDLESDAIVTDAVATAPNDAIVVFDCTFLQRGALRANWDEVIYLEVDRDVAVARGVARDADALGGAGAARRAYEDRYMAACDIYVREENPSQRASIVIDHNDPETPHIVR